MSLRTMVVSGSAAAVVAGLTLAAPGFSAADPPQACLDYFSGITDDGSCTAPARVDDPDARVALTGWAVGGGGGAGADSLPPLSVGASDSEGGRAAPSTIAAAGNDGLGGHGGLAAFMLNVPAGAELDYVIGRGGLGADPTGGGAGGGGSTAVLMGGVLAVEAGGGGGGAGVGSLAAGSDSDAAVADVALAVDGGDGGGEVTPVGAAGAGPCSGGGGNTDYLGSGGAGGAGETCSDNHVAPSSGGSSPVGHGGSGGTLPLGMLPDNGGAGYHDGGSGGGQFPNTSQVGGGGGGGGFGGGGGGRGAQTVGAQAGAGGGGGSYANPQLVPSVRHDVDFRQATQAEPDGPDGFVQFFVEGPTVLTEAQPPTAGANTATTTSTGWHTQFQPNATVPDTGSTTFDVQYSTDCTLESGVQTAHSVDVGSPGETQIVARYQGLQPDTTYCYRLVGTLQNLQIGTESAIQMIAPQQIVTLGKIESFRTQAAAAPPVSPPASPPGASPSPSESPAPDPVGPRRQKDYLKVSATPGSARPAVGKKSKIVKKIKTNGKTKIKTSCTVGGARTDKLCRFTVNRKSGAVSVVPQCNDQVIVHVKVVARYQQGRDTWKRTWRVKGAPRISCSAEGNG